MKFALLGISHETNTFSKIPANYDQFKNSARDGILYGDKILNQFRHSNYTIAGYMEASEIYNFKLIPLMYAQTGPIGTITKDAYDVLSSEMFEMLKSQGPWDAVLI
ncbi:MAG: M81 family metallopeptidase, partial [SAR202 cluster bacterium]|nr:M81 family metallopeptidase [SAR202 cluster bacterium]